MVFLSSGKSYVFLRNFEKALLEILMCSSTFWFSWKIYMCSCTIFVFPGKKWCVLIKGLCLLLENSYVFFLHPSLLENLMCFRNIFKKVTPGQKEQSKYKSLGQCTSIPISLSWPTLALKSPRRKMWSDIGIFETISVQFLGRAVLRSGLKLSSRSSKVLKFHEAYLKLC